MSTAAPPSHDDTKVDRLGELTTFGGSSRGLNEKHPPQRLYRLQRRGAMIRIWVAGEQGGLSDERLRLGPWWLAWEPLLAYFIRPCCFGMAEADEEPNRFLIALAVLELLPTQPSAPLLHNHFRRREARARRASRTCPERWLSLLLFPQGGRHVSLCNVRHASTPRAAPIASEPRSTLAQPPQSRRARPPPR
jgi:hypothetical protein